MGISDISRLGFGLMDGVVWNDLSDKRRNKIISSTINLARKYRTYKTGRKGLKVHMFFVICKMLHKGLLKKEESPSADNQHWINNGWL